MPKKTLEERIEFLKEEERFQRELAEKLSRQSIAKFAFDYEESERLLTLARDAALKRMHAWIELKGIGVKGYD